MHLSYEFIGSILKFKSLIGLFTAMGDFLIGKYAYIGFGIMLISFYLMYLSKKK